MWRGAELGFAPKMTRQSLPQGGGKSGLHRAECQVTPGRREPTASATESKPPMALRGSGKGETVR